MTAQDLRQHPLALSRIDRALLFADRITGFRPADREPKPKKKRMSNFGRVKAVALKIVAGHYGRISIGQVAQRESVPYDSLRVAHWKLIQAKQEGAA